MTPTNLGADLVVNSHHQVHNHVRPETADASVMAKSSQWDILLIQFNSSLEVHFICSSFKLQDDKYISWFIPSWAEKKCCQSEVNSQNDNYFHSEICFFKPDHIDWKKLICSACNDNYFCLSLRYITWFMSQQPKFNTDVEQVSCWQLIQLSFERVLSIGYTD